MSTTNGSKKTRRPTREAILKAMQSKPAGGYFVWDGKDEDERPLTREEMQSGIEADRRRRGRPAGSSKSSTTIRFDTDVLEAFRAGGPGWQTRMNEVLRRWLKRHPTAR